MAFCSNTSGSGTPPPTTPPLSATSGAASPAPSLPPGGTIAPEAPVSSRNVFTGADGTLLNGKEGGWREAINPLVRGMMPQGVQSLLGMAGMQGMPTPVQSVGNKPTVAEGMNNPQIMSMIPKMQDPGEQKNSKGGGKMSSL